MMDEIPGGDARGAGRSLPRTKEDRGGVSPSQGAYGGRRQARAPGLAGVARYGRARPTAKANASPTRSSSPAHHYPLSAHRTSEDQAAVAETSEQRCRPTRQARQPALGHQQDDRQA